MTDLGCFYDPEGDALEKNTFIQNGDHHNPGNADYGRTTLDTGQLQNCFSGKVAPDGSAPADLEFIDHTGGKIRTKAHTAGPLLAQVLCDPDSNPVLREPGIPSPTQATW